LHLHPLVNLIATDKTVKPLVTKRFCAIETNESGRDAPFEKIYHCEPEPLRQDNAPCGDDG